MEVNKIRLHRHSLSNRRLRLISNNNLPNRCKAGVHLNNNNQANLRALLIYRATIVGKLQLRITLRANLKVKTIHNIKIGAVKRGKLPRSPSIWQVQKVSLILLSRCLSLPMRLMMKAVASVSPASQVSITLKHKS